MIQAIQPLESERFANYHGPQRQDPTRALPDLQGDQGDDQDVQDLYPAEVQPFAERQRRMDIFLVMDTFAEITPFYLDHLFKINMKNYPMMVKYLLEYQITYHRDKNDVRMKDLDTHTRSGS